MRLLSKSDPEEKNKLFGRLARSLPIVILSVYLAYRARGAARDADLLAESLALHGVIQRPDLAPYILTADITAQTAFLFATLACIRAIIAILPTSKRRGWISIGTGIAALVVVPIASSAFTGDWSIPANNDVYLYVGITICFVCAGVGDLIESANRNQSLRYSKQR